MRSKVRVSETYNLIMNKSRCGIKVRRDKDSHELLFVEIELLGLAAKFPSTSNNSCRIGGKYKTPKTKDRLRAAKDLFVMQCLRLGVQIPQFDITPVHVQVLLSKSSNRMDSHNLCKPIGDWLEDIGLIYNDRYAQIHCYRRTDYETVLKGVVESTVMTIMRMDSVYSMHKDLILKTRGLYGSQAKQDSTDEGRAKGDPVSK